MKIYSDGNNYDIIIYIKYTMVYYVIQWGNLIIPKKLKKIFKKSLF